MKNILYAFLVTILLVVNNSTLQAQSYCNSKGTLPWEQWISHFYISTIHSSFGNASVKEGYGNFTNIPGFKLIRNVGNLITIDPQSSWSLDPRNSNMYWRVWIDYNNNGDFSDAGEMVISRQVVIYQGTFLDNEAAFTPPATARLGKTRVRVSMKVGGYPEPCETFERGEVEDYTVDIIDDNVPVGKDTLRIVSVNGGTDARQGGQITLNVTLKNTGNAASNPSTPLSIFQNQQPWAFKGPQPTCFSIISDKQPINKSIQPNETVTVPITFTMSGDFTNKSPNIIPPVTFGATQITLGERGTGYCVPLYLQPNVDTLFSYYNIIPILDVTDLAIEIIATDATYGLDGKINYQIKVSNKGAFKAKNVVATLAPPFIPQKGTINSGSFLGEAYTQWLVGDLVSGETTFADVQISDPTLASSMANIVRNVSIFSNQIQDLNAANNSATKTFTFRGPSLPDLTMANLNIPNPNVVAGNVLNFYFDLKNIGAGNATGDFKVKAYVSKDNLLSADDIEVGNVPTGNYNAGFSFLQIPGAATIPSNLATGAYFLILKADADNQIIESNENNNTISASFTITPVSGAYCFSRGNLPWEQWIEQVSIAGPAGGRTFPKTVKEGYGNFTQLTPADIARGKACIITISPQASWGNDPVNTQIFWRVWIDWNNDNVFDDATELMITRGVTISNGVFLDNYTSFIVPFNAKLGKTRMRVAMKVGGLPSACETFNRGEVEDYSINVIDNPSLIQPLIIQGNLSVIAEDRKVRLDWFQKSDAITSFEIEKSLNGENFKHLISEPSNNKKYHFVYDNSPNEGLNFYRLKMNLEGNSALYSDIQKIIYNRVDAFSIFPNPASDEAYIDLSPYTDSAVNIQISDLAGRIMSNQLIENATSTPLKLELSGFETGVYFVSLKTKNKMSLVRKIQVTR